jgi:GNAT superfamily N-acetyltransferase
MRLYPVRDDELEAVCRLVNLAYRGGEGAGWTEESAHIAGERTTPDLLRADLAKAPDARLLALKDEGSDTLLGSVWLEPLKDGAWLLAMLSVRPDLQDRKLGRAVLDAASDMARAAGARALHITVLSPRDTLIAWYERRGFVRTGTTEPFPYGEDKLGQPARAGLYFVVLEKAL